MAKREKTDVEKLVDGLVYFAKIINQTGHPGMLLTPGRVCSIPEYPVTNEGKFLGEVDIVYWRRPDQAMEGLVYIWEIYDFILAQFNLGLNSMYTINVGEFLSFIKYVESEKMIPVGVTVGTDGEGDLTRESFDITFVDKVEAAAVAGGAINSLKCQKFHISRSPFVLIIPRLSFPNIENVYGNEYAYEGYINIDPSRLSEIYESTFPIKIRISMKSDGSSGDIMISRNLLLKEMVKYNQGATIHLFRKYIDIENKRQVVLLRISTSYAMMEINTDVISIYGNW